MRSAPAAPAMEHEGDRAGSTTGIPALTKAVLRTALHDVQRFATAAEKEAFAKKQQKKVGAMQGESYRKWVAESRERGDGLVHAWTRQTKLHHSRKSSEMGKDSAIEFRMS